MNHYSLMLATGSISSISHLSIPLSLLKCIKSIYYHELRHRIKEVAWKLSSYCIYIVTIRDGFEILHQMDSTKANFDYQFEEKLLPLPERVFMAI